MFVHERSVHSRTPWGLLRRVRTIAVLPKVRSVHFRVPRGSLRSLGCVCTIPVRARGLLIRSGAFGPFPCAQSVVGFVGVRSVHSRAP